MEDKHTADEWRELLGEALGTEEMQECLRKAIAEAGKVPVGA